MTDEAQASAAAEAEGSEDLASMKAQKAKPKYEPVQISGTAQKTLAQKWRQWSGWHDGAIEFGDVDYENKTTGEGTDIAVTNMLTHRVEINGARLIRNPNRVLNSVTPFRLKQEAVLTGVLLHEAGHARHSLWYPMTEQAMAKFRHGDGSEVHQKTANFARLLEEARVEGKIAGEARTIGAGGLEWTMRAAAAHLLPMTKVSDNEAQAVMDVIGSWVKRAGRMKALNLNPQWVADFDEFLETTIHDWLIKEQMFTPSALGAAPPVDPDADTDLILQYLDAMLRVWDDQGCTMVDYAKNVLDLLFRNQSDDDRPDADQGMHGAVTEGEGGNSDGEESETQAALASFEESANDEAGEEQAAQSKTGVEQDNPEKNAPTGLQGGRGTPNTQKGYRDPTPEERALQRGAERFLRSLISPTESSKVMVTDSPSAMVDPVAYSAWKAGGMVREPRFFKQVKRSVDPAPPVRIAILVDVSGSMQVLQKPSAVLSWALASAALDLSNFAGRGQQIESCLIHWGDNARVFQEVGARVPGIHTVPCDEGTSAMHLALKKVEEQMPDFFDAQSRTNRLIVQFTDWQLMGTRDQSKGVTEYLTRAARSGVNMLSITPHNNKSHLGYYEPLFRSESGDSTHIVYNDDPAQVWKKAAAALVDRH